MTFRLLCTISGHGFGHLSQVAPLLNRLAERVPGLQVGIVSALPHRLLSRLVHVEFSLENRAQDVGLVQSDPMQVDRPGTARALRALHGAWDHRLEAEKRAMTAWQPDLLMTDIPYLPIAAAADLGVPSVAIASLSWDAVLAAYFSREDPEIEGWWQGMRQAYARTTLALMPTPAILEGTPFPHRQEINPLTTLGRRLRGSLRQTLQIPAEDDRPLILVTLGGIPARNLPVDALAREPRCHWLLDTPLSGDLPPHVHDMQAMLSGWVFADVTASVDGVVSKPGYGMAITAATRQIPFLYLRRGLFPDEPVICRWLERVGRCAELDATSFYAGAWYAPLRTLLDRPSPRPPPANGDEQGAAIVAERFCLAT